MLTIRTNHRPRELVCLADLPKRARAEFDYIDDPHDARLFCYRRAWYDAHEFERTGAEHPVNQLRTLTAGAWDGIQTDSYFSAILIRWGDRNCESVIVGRCYS